MSDENKNNDPNPDGAERSEALAKIRQAIGKIRYGAVEIVIHNSRVVQIEAREKIRLNHETK